MDEAVAAALAAHPRAGFLPEGARYRADHDGPVHIGRGQTCSQPRTVAEMLRLLQVAPGQHVLDIGAGSGWTTALLAHLVGPRGSVIGVEIEPELVAFGSANLSNAGTPWGTIRQAPPGVLGAPEEAPFDRILVSADADSVPPQLLDQLGDPGRMVVPVDGWMTVVVKEAGLVSTSRHGPYRFVPLR